MELADVTDSKSVGLITRAGSTPATGTKIAPAAFAARAIFIFAGVEKDRSFNLQKIYLFFFKQIYIRSQGDRAVKRHSYSEEQSNTGQRRRPYAAKI